MGEDPGLDLDPTGEEQRADGLARGRSEDGERGLLGGDDGDPDVVEPELESPPLRHQGELVDRQRPGDPGRHDEGDPPRPLAGPKQVIDPKRLAARWKRRRTLQSRTEAAARTNDQEVVFEPRAVAELDGVLVRPHARRGLLDEVGPELSHQRPERVLLRRPEVERLLDQQRLIEEVGIGGNEDEFDAITRKIVQRHQRLQPGNAAADDDHSTLHEARSIT